MGNNTQISYEKWKKTHTGDRIDYELSLEGYSEEWIWSFRQNIKEWVYGGSLFPGAMMDLSQIQYIQNHMKSSLGDPEVENGQLTRVEDEYHWEDANIGVGDILPSDSTFKAYSRSREATARYMATHKEGPVVIYRTNGSVSHFNVSEFNSAFKEEKESWVEPGKLKVTRVTEYSDTSGVRQCLEKEFGVNVDKLVYDDFHSWDDVDKITLVDVAPV